MLTVDPLHPVGWELEPHGSVYFVKHIPHMLNWIDSGEFGDQINTLSYSPNHSWTFFCIPELFMALPGPKVSQQIIALVRHTASFDSPPSHRASWYISSPVKQPGWPHDVKQKVIHQTRALCAIAPWLCRIGLDRLAFIPLMHQCNMTLSLVYWLFFLGPHFRC